MILAELIRRQGGLISKILTGNAGDATKTQFTEIRQSGNCLVYQASVGRKKFAVKAFDPSASESPKSWQREVGCQVALSKTGLIPALRGHNQKELFVVSDWQAGQDLRTVLTDETLRKTARTIGAWYKGFTGKIHASNTDTNWDDYLVQYTTQGLDQAFSDSSELLQSVKIEQLSIAKNDAHLSNFILDPDGKLMGIDFAEASLKPVGWDILLTARVLHRLYPKKSDQYLPALMQGWFGSDPKDDVERFTKLARVFAEKTAFIDLG